jgi:hypothetical protein
MDVSTSFCELPFINDSAMTTDNKGGGLHKGLCLNASIERSERVPWGRRDAKKFEHESRCST